MRLALALGCPNVDAMLRSMSAPQLAEWEAFYSVEPFGWNEEWRRSAMIASTTARMAGKRMREGASVTVADFIPRYVGPAPRESLVEKVKAIFGGK